jgi:predicted DNA-binding transcriptional regulator AlpA
MESRRILRTPHAAAYVGLSPSSLEKMRLIGDGPAFIRLGERIVGYDVRDLDAWLERRRRCASRDHSITV